MLSGGLRTKNIIKHSQTNMPLITIVTVVFNGEKTLEKTILSIVNQTYSNIEYIIIDGSSTDSTLEIIRKYDNQIDYWISEPDEGIYYAMNKGIVLASGEWINFMNSGDTFYSKNTCFELADKNYLSRERSIIYGDRLKDIDNRLLIQKSNIRSIHWIMGLFHQSCFIHTSLHKKYSYNTVYRIAADYDFLYKMYDLKVSFIKVDSIICIFLNGGFSSNINIQLKEVLAVINNNNKSIIKKLYYSFRCVFRPFYITHMLNKYLPLSLIYKHFQILYHKMNKSYYY